MPSTLQSGSQQEACGFLLQISTSAPLRGHEAVLIATGTDVVISVLSDCIEQAPSCTEHAVVRGTHAGAVEQVQNLCEPGRLANLLAAAYASYDAARDAAPASTRTDAGVELALCCASEGWALPPCWR